MSEKPALKTMGAWFGVVHIMPLSIGGPDTPDNMRLPDIDMHKMHHRYYRPWK